MLFEYYKTLVFLVIIAIVFGQNLDNLTDRQRSRIRNASRRDKSKELTSFEKKTKFLFKLIHGRPENKDIESEPCEIPPLVIPDFRGPDLRVSDVKCLENLWKIRYYDEALISTALCSRPTQNMQLYSIVTAVAGGVDAVAGEYPHMGAIGWETVNDTWLFMCEGALVSEKYMLTAAHCSQLPRPDLRVTDPTPKIVRLGEANISDKEDIGKSPLDVSIKRFIFHPYYRRIRKYYDIALVEFQNDVVLTSKVYPACIWTNSYDPTGPLELTGWNTIETNKTVSKKEFISDSFDVFTRLTLSRKIADEDRHKDSSPSNPVLQLAKVNLMNTWTCERLIRNNRNNNKFSCWYGLLFHQLCAARHRAANNTDCQEDSGGILQARLEIPEYTDWNMHYLIGVRSFGFGCESPLEIEFGVYSKASVFVDWIENVVWGAHNNTPA